MYYRDQLFIIAVLQNLFRYKAFLISLYLPVLFFSFIKTISDRNASFKSDSTNNFCSFKLEDNIKPYKISNSYRQPVSQGVSLTDPIRNV